MIAARHLTEALRDQPTIDQYIANAEGMLADARRAANSPHGRFILAYEAIHCLAMAYFNHHWTRFDGEGHRDRALKTFIQQIGLNKYFAVIDRAHRTRNDKTYHRPAPPVDAATIATLTDLLAEALPLVTQETAQPAA